MTDTDDALKQEMLDHLPALRAFARSLAGSADTADDIVQDALEKALANLDSFTPGTSLRAWLFTILRNGYVSRLRKAGREVGDPEGALTESLAVKPRHDGHLQMLEFRDAFAALSDDQREALFLVGVMGFTYDEAASVADVPAGTVKSRVSRAREDLAVALGLEGGDFDLTEEQILSVVNEQAKTGV